MRIRVLLLVIGLAPMPAIAQPATPAEAVDRHMLSDPQISPDGKRVAFTVTEPPTGQTLDTNVYVLDIATGATRRFATSPKDDSGARWSPDGRSLAFVSDRSGMSQLHIIPADGGEARRIDTGRHAVRNVVWSPDGKRIAFLARVPKTDDDEKRTAEFDDEKVVDDPQNVRRIWIVDVESGKPRQLLNGTWEASEVVWAPSGSRLYAIATDKPGSDQWIDDIISVDVESSAVARVASPKRVFTRLTISPDGRTLAYVGARKDGPAPYDLLLQPVDGGPPRNVTEKFDRTIASYGWAGDGSLVALALTGFTSRLSTIGQDGTATLWPTSGVHPAALAVASDGSIAFVGQTATNPMEIWTGARGAAAERKTDLSARWASRRVVAPEIVKYKSFDGRDIEAAVRVPPGVGRPAPLVVLVHGGPAGRFADQYDQWSHLLVSNGYVVLQPNIRGSIGYGREFLELNRADWGGGDFKDVMAGVDHLVARGLADPDRVGIGGWSYGGYMASWAVTQTTRFKAAVSGAGMADLASEFGTEDSSAYDEWYFGLPYENLREFTDSSPVTFIKNVRTPTLILQGEADLVDPIGQSQQLHRPLKRYGVPTQMVTYPREGHRIDEYKHQLDVLQRVLDWFNRWVKDASAKSSAQEFE